MWSLDVVKTSSTVYCTLHLNSFVPIILLIMSLQGDSSFLE
jgi:hypothetical protein